MKPELFAGVILIIIIFAAIWNLYFLSSLVQDVTELCQMAESEASQRNWTAAENAANAALNLWDSHERYLQTVLRQSECDRVTDVLWRLLAAICNRETGTVEGTAEQADEVFRHLAETELPLFSSIF